MTHDSVNTTVVFFGDTLSARSNVVILLGPSQATMDAASKGAEVAKASVLHSEFAGAGTFAPRGYSAPLPMMVWRYAHSLLLHGSCILLLHNTWLSII